MKKILLTAVVLFLGILRVHAQEALPVIETSGSSESVGGSVSSGKDKQRFEATFSIQGQFDNWVQETSERRPRTDGLILDMSLKKFFTEYLALTLNAESLFFSENNNTEMPNLSAASAPSSLYLTGSLFFQFFKKNKYRVDIDVLRFGIDQTWGYRTSFLYEPLLYARYEWLEVNATAALKENFKKNTQLIGGSAYFYPKWYAGLGVHAYYLQWPLVRLTRTVYVNEIPEQQPITDPYLKYWSGQSNLYEKAVCQVPVGMGVKFLFPRGDNKKPLEVPYGNSGAEAVALYSHDYLGFSWIARLFYTFN